MNFILIDASYYIFYRYHAMNIWWKHSKPEDTECRPQDSEEFKEKFRAMFLRKIEEMNDKLGIKSSIKIAGKDCRRADIWRNGIYPQYKGTRADCSETVGPFFGIVDKENLFHEAGVGMTVAYPTLEADDCIAITTKYISKNFPDAHIWIITGDMDYLQLSNEKVHLYSLQYKDLTHSKNCSGNPEKDLFCKIVAGDTSDNISAVFPRCGPKTAAKYYEDKELFHEKLASSPDSVILYERNKTLVDFNNIPEELVMGFTDSHMPLFNKFIEYM